MTFVRRLLSIRFILGEGTFGETGQNTVDLSGLRITSKILKAGGPSMGTLDMQVFGMTASLMNQLSTLGLIWTQIRRNTVVLSAFDEGAVPSVVFQGTITNAWADFQAAPDVAFHVEAHTGLLEAVSSMGPTSFVGGADVALIMSGLATKMGLAFENSGITSVLSNPYFWGSPRNQVQACADAAGINWIIDNGKLAIWPRGGARGGAVPLISPATGMIGYPAYTSKGIMVRTLYNPSIGYGGLVEVQSSQQPASGQWVVYGLDHDLDAQFPGGKWETNLSATRPGLGPVIGR